MSLPKIVAKQPVILELEAGIYWWCKCGKSQNSAFCDGSHRGTEFAPTQFELAEKQKVALCQCKYTKNPPFCDGTHSQL
ncbi:CDGSH iron-sulfur domain-containing protein [Pleurocapsales cyanobacterium LEGE 10410]|nr:CDGSH iron-sulfur domain-containing protein [Pleurocapsales cyanobacterium LEGE 10410]